MGIGQVFFQDTGHLGAEAGFIFHTGISGQFIDGLTYCCEIVRLFFLFDEMEEQLLHIVAGQGF